MKEKILLILFGLITGVGIALIILLFLPSQHPSMISDNEELLTVMDNDPSSIFLLDEHISYRLKPDFTGQRFNNDRFLHETNTRGLLGRTEVSPDKSNILFLGDSVLYGDHIAYEDSLVPQLQKLTGEQPILFAGACPGWSTYQELGYFRLYVSDIPWEKIVVLFCLNDLVDFEWVYDSEEGFKMSQKMQSIGGLFHLTNSIDALKLAAVRNRFAKDKRTDMLKYHNNTCLFSYLDAKWNSFTYEVLRPFVESYKQNLIIVSVPTIYQLQALNLNAPVETVLFPQHRMQAFCRAQGIEYLDVSPYLSKYIPADLFIDDLHFSAYGCAEIARALYTSNILRTDKR